MDEKDIKILIIYVGVAGIRGIDIPDTVNKIAKRIIPSTFEGEIIVIPTQSYDTKIECINPKYITDEKLIEEHTQMIKTLNNELKHQLNQLKNEKNVE